MKKMVFYGRYSSSNQNEQSIEGQFHVCERYAKQNGIEITAKYIDRATSGTNDNRPQFQKMIKDSSGGNFEGVLVYKLDRFARNRYDSALYKKKLRDNGVKVVSATENISESPEGIIMEGLLEAMDEYYSVELSRKVKRGKQESFRKGQFLGRTTPFGYSLKNHKLTVDDAKAEIVRDIFRRYANGEKLSSLVQYLNETGITNSTGGRWHNSGMSRLLHNKVYIGEYHYGDIEGFAECPAIVSAELFQTVQDLLEESAHRKRTNKTGYDYMLTGKLICAGCGCKIGGVSSHRKNFYYKCRYCSDSKRVKAEYMHEKVMTALSEYLTKDKVSEIASLAYREYQKEQQADERPALEKELHIVTQQLQNAVNAIIQGIELDELNNTISELKSRQKALEQAVCNAPATIPKLEEKYFTFTLEKMTEKKGRELFNTVVNQVVLKDDKAILCINLTDVNNIPPLKQLQFNIPEIPVCENLNNISFVSGWLLIVA